jgi:hypothetical protein
LTPLRPNALVVKFHALIYITAVNGVPPPLLNKAIVFPLEKSF